MELHRAEELAAQGLLSPDQVQGITDHYRNRLFSLHWELRTILYLGVSLFSGGVGILVYKNIDTIGHQAIMAVIALLCAASFFYVFRKATPFTLEESGSSSPFFDYVLLLGALLFVSLESYLQYQYTIFGGHYNLVTLLPALLFLYLAYRFDHRGILSMAITGFAGSVGLTVTPLDLLRSNDFSSVYLIATGIGFGLVTGGAALLLRYRNIKKHFTFTYFNFASHMAFTSTLAGLFQFDRAFLFVALLAFLAWATYRYAIFEKSLYFLLVTILYTYVGLTYLFIRMIIKALDFSGDSAVAIFYLALLYLAATSIGVIQLFRRYRTILRISE